MHKNITVSLYKNCLESLILVGYFFKVVRGTLYTGGEYQVPVFENDSTR
jgi:hypothetical protein